MENTGPGTYNLKLERETWNAAGLLAPYRVLDLTNEYGFLCGKILADLGADVVKVEPPGGDPARQIGSQTFQVSGNLEGLRPASVELGGFYWLAYNANKRGITLNLETAPGQELLRGLAERSDFLVESFAPGYLDSLGLGYAALSALNPRLIVVSITPLGQSGPYRDYKGSDLIAMAMSGMMSLVGEPDRPPVRISLAQAPLWTGMYAAGGSLIAHWHREQTGQGQQVDISLQAGVLWALANAPAFWIMNQENIGRAGSLMVGRSLTGAKFHTVHPCKDGYINFIIYGGEAGKRSNQALVEWLEEEGLCTDALRRRDWDRFNVAHLTQAEVDEIEGPARQLFQRYTKCEFMEQAVRREMLGYPVSTAPDLLDDPQLAARGFWQSIPHPDGSGALAYPGGFARFSAASCGLRRPPPKIGEHNEEVYGGELGLSHEELAGLQSKGVV